MHKTSLSLLAPGMSTDRALMVTIDLNHYRLTPIWIYRQPCFLARRGRDTARLLCGWLPRAGPEQRGLRLPRVGQGGGVDEGGTGGPPFGSRVLLGQAYQAGWDAVACLLQEGAFRPGSTLCVKWFGKSFLQVHNIGVDTVGTGIMGKLGNKVEHLGRLLCLTIPWLFREVWVVVSDFMQRISVLSIVTWPRMLRSSKEETRTTRTSARECLSPQWNGQTQTQCQYSEPSASKITTWFSGSGTSTTGCQT